MPPRFLLWALVLLAACADAPAGDSLPAPSESHPDARSAATTEPETTEPETTERDRTRWSRIRGVTLDARREPPPTLLPEFDALGATHIAVVPFAFQRRTDDPALRTNYDARWYTEGDAGIRALARQADSLGLRLVLKPHVWIGADGEEQWSSNIGFDEEADWQRWEAQYRDFALHYAGLSAEIDAPLFVIGTELARAVREREAFWRGLIAEIRTVYGGRITYAANWHEDFEHVPFWDALDAVGIQAYFPLSELPAPTPADLRAGWARHEAAVEAVHRRTGKPVVFTEIGYRDMPHAAARPWEWPGRHERTAEPDSLRAAGEALQAALYTAFFQEVWPEPWMAGAIVWKWHPPSDRSRAGDFTPQGKPAEAVIRRGFGERIER